MCGIIAVVRRRTTRTPPTPEAVLGLLQPLPALLDIGGVDETLEARLLEAAKALDDANALLSGVPGVHALLFSPDVRAAVHWHCVQLATNLGTIDQQLDSGRIDLSADRLEGINAALLRTKDVRWAIAEDRVRTAEAVADLLNGTSGSAAVEAFTSVQTALSALDRLEVRGRDSAGLHLLVTGHGLDLESPGVRSMLEQRANDPLFRNGAVCNADGDLSFVYKAAAEIGELGDNTRVLRSAITSDELLHLAVTSEAAEVTVLGHTRWASVGIISEANAHPLNSEEDGGRSGPYVVAASTATSTTSPT